jgi:hypothetical protein
MPKNKSRLSLEKHCPTCTCNQRGIKQSSFFIRQTISHAPKEVVNDKDALESILQLMGHSQTTIRQAIDSRTITPASSLVNSGGKEIEQKTQSQRPSMESTTEDEGYLYDICIENKKHSTNKGISNIQEETKGNDSNLPSPVINSKKCWHCFL